MGDAHRRPNESDVGEGQARAAEQGEAFVFDLAPERVHRVVVGDNPVGFRWGSERLARVSDTVATSSSVFRRPPAKQSSRR